MRSLKSQQSKVKDQGQYPLCVLYACASAIEEATIKSGRPIIIDPNQLQKDAEATFL